MSRLKEIEESYGKLLEDDKQRIIEFFDSNSDFLLSDEIDDISTISCIYEDYIFALYDKSQYSKIIDISEKYKRIESIKNFAKLNNEFNKVLMFYKSASQFNKKRYFAAKRGFLKLREQDPENENYIDWYKDCNVRISKWILTLIMFSSIGLAFLVLILRTYLSIPIPKSIGSVFEGIFITTFILNLIYNLIKSK